MDQSVKTQVSILSVHMHMMRQSCRRLSGTLGELPQLKGGLDKTLFISKLDQFCGASPEDNSKVGTSVAGLSSEARARAEASVVPRSRTFDLHVCIMSSSHGGDVTFTTTLCAI